MLVSVVIGSRLHASKPQKNYYGMCLSGDSPLSKNLKANKVWDHRTCPILRRCQQIEHALMLHATKQGGEIEQKRGF